MKQVLALLLLLGTMVGAAQTAPEFSARLSITGIDGVPTEGMIYVGADKARVETQVGQMQAVTLADLKGQSYSVLFPQEKTYISYEAAALASLIPAGLTDLLSNNPCANPNSSGCESLGTQNIAGRTAQGYRMNSGGQIIEAWTDTVSGIPLRQVLPDGRVIELSDINTSPPAAELFEVPSDYRQLGMGDLQALPGMGLPQPGTP